MILKVKWYVLYNLVDITLFGISPHSDQNNSKYGHFLRNGIH